MEHVLQGGQAASTMVIPSSGEGDFRATPSREAINLGESQSKRAHRAEKGLPRLIHVSPRVEPRKWVVGTSGARGRSRCESDGFTALQYAARFATIDKVARLLDSGADLNAKDVVLGGTALHAAAAGGRLEVVTLLLDRGAELGGTTTTGATPLHLAAANGRSEVATLLLNSRAHPGIKDNTAITPLHLAASHGHYDMVALLLDHGAMPDAMDANGATPLDSAIKKGNQGVAAFLHASTCRLDLRHAIGSGPCQARLIGPGVLARQTSTAIS